MSTFSLVGAQLPLTSFFTAQGSQSRGASTRTRASSSKRKIDDDDELAEEPPRKKGKHKENEAPSRDVVPHTKKSGARAQGSGSRSKTSGGRVPRNATSGARKLHKGARKVIAEKDEVIDLTGPDPAPSSYKGFPEHGEHAASVSTPIQRVRPVNASVHSLPTPPPSSVPLKDVVPSDEISGRSAPTMIRYTVYTDTRSGLRESRTFQWTPRNPYLTRDHSPSEGADDVFGPLPQPSSGEPEVLAAPSPVQEMQSSPPLPLPEPQDDVATELFHPQSTDKLAAIPSHALGNAKPQTRTSCVQTVAKDPVPLLPGSEDDIVPSSQTQELMTPPRLKPDARCLQAQLSPLHDHTCGEIVPTSQSQERDVQVDIARSTNRACVRNPTWGELIPSSQYAEHELGSQVPDVRSCLDLVPTSQSQFEKEVPLILGEHGLAVKETADRHLQPLDDIGRRSQRILQRTLSSSGDIVDASRRPEDQVHSADSADAFSASLLPDSQTQSFSQLMTSPLRAPSSYGSLSGDAIGNMADAPAEVCAFFDVFDEEPSWFGEQTGAGAQAQDEDSVTEPETDDEPLAAVQKSTTTTRVASTAMRPLPDEPSQTGSEADYAAGSQEELGRAAYSFEVDLLSDATAPLDVPEGFEGSSSMGSMLLGSDMPDEVRDFFALPSRMFSEEE
ncbi:hypothetical protein B0H21DRAFT_193716 [Amylocystis lapponica]|nr:hypothetical protein B0H21DRAFT_193716 [Amylocystis lapponica]